MGYHNNDPEWQKSRLREINDEANQRMLEIAESFIWSANVYPCSGVQPERRTVPLHDAAAVARACLTYKSEYEAWRKRAEQAETELNNHLHVSFTRSAEGDEG